MNLKTHTAYSEINVDNEFNFTCAIYNQKGKRLFKRNGSESSRDEAIQSALRLINSEADKYLREEQ